MATHPTTSKSSNHYSGHWTKEEQDYVAILIEGFRGGLLDIPDGTSLRTFIAAKLECKPKRVSKKYERTGLNGRQIYHRDVGISDKKQQDYRSRLEDLENKFHESRALVVRMQQAKTEDTTLFTPSSQTSSAGTPMWQQPTQTASVATMSPDIQALEERLVAMRKLLDQRAAGMLSLASAAAASRAATTGTCTGTGLGQSSSLLQRGNSHGMQGSSSLQRGNSHGMQGSSMVYSPHLSAGVLDSYLLNHGAAANGLWHNPNGGFTPHAMPVPQHSNANKLLSELYHRRQQLAMAVGGVHQNTADASMTMTDATLSHNDRMMMMNGTTSNTNKRGMEQYNGDDELAESVYFFKRPKMGLDRMTSIEEGVSFR